MLWHDRTGRFSALKAATLGVLVLPGLWIGWSLAAGTLGPRPINAAIHETGKWAVYFLLASLAVTPVRRAWNWPRLALIRRMVGVAAFAYSAIHLALYIVDLGFDLGKVALEIVLRWYLTIGFAALLGLTALGATSTDGMVKRLGGKAWRRLHLLVHPIAVLALTHHFLQSKLDVWGPTLLAGVYTWLVAVRVVRSWRGDRLPLRDLAAIGLAVGAGAVLAEAAALAFTFNAPFLDVLAVAFDVEELRPGWYVLAGGIAVAGVAAVIGRRRARAALPD